MIEQRYTAVKSKIPNHVQLIAVSKTKPDEDIMCLYELGHRHFGENKVQELVGKYERLPKDIQWHMIGHLQSNKVKYIASFVTLIHGVDSLKLLKEIEKQALRHNRVIDVLLQFHIAQEDSKFGLKYDQVNEIMNSVLLMKSVRITGVMGMASFVEDISQIQSEFKTLKKIFEDLKFKYFGNEPSFDVISMGMSGDYQMAIEEGSTMVRVGSSIFGLRN
jgi:pyridoxal phosphate enzyme (YggS family)